MTKSQQEKALDRAKELAEVINAFIGGAAIESRLKLPGTRWVLDSAPDFIDPHMEFRVKIPEAVIPWDALRDEVVAVARDDNGTIWPYSSVPTKNDQNWTFDGDIIGAEFDLDVIKIFLPDVPWAQAVPYIRPGYKKSKKG